VPVRHISPAWLPGCLLDHGALIERLLTQPLLAESAGMTVPSTSGPQHAAPSRFSRRTLAIVLASIGGVLVLCCAGAIHVGLFAGPKTGSATAIWTATALPDAPGSASPAPSETPTTAPNSSAPSTATLPGTEICQVAYNGGTIYLYVTSATAHNFKVCAGGTPYAGTIDQLTSSGAGIDLRCDLGSDYTAQNNAAVAVYSDTGHGDMKAAQRFCSASGGNDQG
jgi:hypothetical protein